MPLYDLTPEISHGAFIAPNASIIGEIKVNEYSSVWHNAVLRGDLNGIYIGKSVHIQDNVCISNMSSLPTGIPAITSIDD